MNAALTLATILSMVLAISGSGTGGSANQKKTDPEQTVETSKDKTNGTIWGSLNGVNLNHNETLVRDAQFKPTIGPVCSPLVCGENHNETLMREVASKPTGGGCAPMECGANHNETLVRDAQFKPTGGTQCSPLTCGSNHNETLMSDAPLESYEWNLPLSGDVFAASFLSELLAYSTDCAFSPFACSNHSETLTRDKGPRGHNLNHNETLVRDAQFHPPTGLTCSPWVCGSNHNETLERDDPSRPTSCPVWLCGANHNETLIHDLVR